MKPLIWAGFALCALLWTGAAAAMSGLLRWSVKLLASGQGLALDQAVTAVPIPVWLTRWVDIGTLHAALDSFVWTLESVQRSWPWVASMLQWLVPVTWVLWGLGLGLMLLLAGGANLLVNRSTTLPRR